MKRVFSFVFVMGLAFPLCDSTRADILEKEVRSSDGKASATGFVYQHNRSHYRTTSRSRRSRDPVIPAGVGVIQVAPISQFVTGVTATPITDSKPRFGYGSDYHSPASQPAAPAKPEPVEPEMRDRPESVPSAKYPDSVIPSVPSYSDPAPQDNSGQEPVPVPDPQLERKSDPSPSKGEPDHEGEDEVAKQLRRALPFIFEQSEVDVNTARGWDSPPIEFNAYPPVYREYYRIQPYFFDPFCRPVIPCPPGRNIGIPFGHTHHFGGPFSGPFCPPFGR